jgi:dTDP-4-dehydrorhamnose reductase
VTGPLLVTGGTGYLGGELLRQAAGRALAATHLSGTPYPVPGVEWLRLDVRDAAAVRREIGRMCPAAVINTAYRQNDPGARETNVDGAETLAAAAAAVGARLLHLSSDLVFDGKRDGAYREEDPLSPVLEYGRTKAEAELAVRAAHPGALVVRTSLIYGGSRPSRHELTALAAAAGRGDVAFFDDELRSPVLAGDLAAALLELVDRDDAGILHVAGADTVSRYEFACLIAAANGVPSGRIRRSSLAAAGLPRPANCALDSSRARALLRTRLRGVVEHATRDVATSRPRP